MIEVGLICKKLKGRDSGKVGVIIDIIDDKTVLMDGEVRRRKCNIKHLEPTGERVNIKKGATREEVKKVFKNELNIELKDTTPKPKKERQKTKRVLRMEENIKRKKEMKKEVQSKKIKKEDKKEITNKTVSKKETKEKKN